MKRLLIIHCPVNPRTLNQERQDDLDITGPGENFRWALLESNNHDATASDDTQHGQGSLRDLPFADEALVLMPTVDVRLIHTKVPMISGKKLNTLLPTLSEPYLLDQRTPLRYQIFPPLPGTKGIERTIAITSDSWMNWLEDQLAALPVRMLTLIPDCLLLAEPDEQQQPRELMASSSTGLQIIACREGDDWGCGWVEANDSAVELAQLYPAAEIHAFDWAWLLPRVQTWMSRKLPINLVQKKPERRKETSGIDKPTARWQAKIEWIHWRKPIHLAGIAFAVYIAGSAINLGLLTLSNWRWHNILAETARQQLGIPDKDNTAALKTLIRQTTRSIHAQGGTTPADFVPMAAKLQVLLNDYPVGLLESLSYQADGLDFSLRSGIETPDASILLKRAAHLQMAVVHKGKNSYRMLPLAGLNQEGR